MSVDNYHCLLTTPATVHASYEDDIPMIPVLSQQTQAGFVLLLPYQLTPSVLAFLQALLDLGAHFWRRGTETECSTPGAVTSEPWRWSL